MPGSVDGPRASFQRIDPAELAARLAGPRPPLVLDVRRGAAFAEQGGIPTALPLALDRDPLQLPDTDREVGVVAYCL